jgi:hypothetical protein
LPFTPLAINGRHAKGSEMRPSAKVAGFVCLVTGLAVGVFIGLLIAHRGGQGHEQGGKPADEQGGKPADEADPEASAFFNPACDLFGKFARGADGLSPVGPAHNTAGHKWLFDRQMARWYFVLSCKLTFDPKVEQPRINPIGELDEKLTALARQKGVVVESAGRPRGEAPRRRGADGRTAHW